MRNPITPVLATTLLTLATAGPASARGDARPAPAVATDVVTLAQVPTPRGEVRFERFADGTVLVTERALGGGGLLRTLNAAAYAKGIQLCAAQVFDLVTGMPAPPELFRRCATDASTPKDALEELRIDAKAFRLYDEIRDRPLLCNGAGNDNAQFRDIECAAQKAELLASPFFDAASMVWCANTLRTSTDRSLAAALGSEGEAASIVAVSCGGNTRFRFYRRDSVGASWNLHRDYILLPSEYIDLYTYDNDSFDDIDFRFRLDSTGGGHRSSGYFIDD